MFNCAGCGSPTRGRPHVRTLETRPKNYFARKDAHFFKKDRGFCVRSDPGGEGFETAKEGNFCSACAESRPEVVRATTLGWGPLIEGGTAEEV